jgi:hypothetical protein
MESKPNAAGPDDETGEFEDFIPEGAEVVSPRLQPSEADDAESEEDLEDGDSAESESDRAGEL